MSEAQKKIDDNYDYHKIVKERTLWVIRPVAVVIMTVWCLHPSTSKMEVRERNLLGGFLLGAFYGLFVHYKIINHFVVVRGKETENIKNRIPDEYYFGRVITALDIKGKGSAS